MVTPIMGTPIPLLAEPLILGSSWDRVECQRWVLGMTMGVLRMKRGVVLVGMDAWADVDCSRASPSPFQSISSLLLGYPLVPCVDLGGIEQDR